jgi:hypothetical protein
VTRLLLDFDGPLPRWLEWRVRTLCLHCGWPVEWMRIDRSRRGWHVVIQLRRRLAPASIVAAQAILGSDWRREVFNLRRARMVPRLDPYWRTRWNVLYCGKVTL